MSELEKRIAALGADESAALRERVMRAVDDELARRRLGVSRQNPTLSGSAWSWWWAAAAALVVVVMNFSFMSAANDGFSSGARADRMSRDIAALRAMELQQEEIFK